MLFTWINRRVLDRLVFRLMEEGIEVSRHSYSYRLLYRGRMAMGIHVYPGYGEISVRLYRAAEEEAQDIKDIVLKVLKEIFPGYRIDIRWYPPSEG